MNILILNNWKIKLLNEKIGGAKGTEIDSKFQLIEKVTIFDLKLHMSTFI